jgi:hypothetical protein
VKERSYLIPIILVAFFPCPMGSTYTNNVVATFRSHSCHSTRRTELSWDAQLCCLALYRSVVCVCVCVCQREREREKRVKQKVRSISERHMILNTIYIWIYVSLNFLVTVCTPVHMFLLHGVLRPCTWSKQGHDSRHPYVSSEMFSNRSSAGHIVAPHQQSIDIVHIKLITG